MVFYLCSNTKFYISSESLSLSSLSRERSLKIFKNHGLVAIRPTFSPNDKCAVQQSKQINQLLCYKWWRCRPRKGRKGRTLFSKIWTVYLVRNWRTNYKVTVQQTVLLVTKSRQRSGKFSKIEARKVFLTKQWTFLRKKRHIENSGSTRKQQLGSHFVFNKFF